MSIKEQHTLNFWWQALYNVVDERQSDATAGQVAVSVGQSRTTAQKYMKRLVKADMATAHRVTHWNGVKKTVYAPVSVPFP